VAVGAVLASQPDPEFDARWHAWMARGHAHEAATRRRLRVIIPVLVAVSAGVLLLLLR
jgi:hypothetical protein